MTKDRIHHEEYIDAHSYENDYVGASRDEKGEYWIQIRYCPECKANNVYYDNKEIFCKNCGLVINDDYDTDLSINETDNNNLESNDGDKKNKNEEK